MVTLKYWHIMVSGNIYWNKCGICFLDFIFPGLYYLETWLLRVVKEKWIEAEEQLKQSGLLCYACYLNIPLLLYILLFWRKLDPSFGLIQWGKFGDLRNVVRIRLVFLQLRGEIRSLIHIGSTNLFSILAKENHIFLF